MQFLDNKTIKFDKEINELDKFAFEFIEILEKHTDYVIISGYVAILLGRTRATEDIDIIIPKLSKEEFAKLYDDLLRNEFWCLNSEDTEDLYDLLISKHSIRFAIEPNVSPNIELKFSKDIYDNLALQNPVIIQLGGKKLKTSFLELQIAYKEEVLKSNKDLEDAKHIRLMAKGYLDENLINEYKRQLREK